MAKFSPTEAVFAGFRFARERPVALLIWSAYYLVVLAVALIALFDLAGDKLQTFLAVQASAPADPGRTVALMQDLLPAWGFACLLLVVFGAVMRTAVLRAYFEPGPHPWAGLRMGGDELRVLGGYAFLLLAIFIGAFLVSVLSVLAAAAIKVWSVLVLIAGLVALMGLIVRLSLTPVVAFKEKQISLRRSWQLTKGQFWPLLGAYVLYVAVCAVVLVLLLVLFAALMGAAALATGGHFSDIGLAMRRQYQGLNPILIGLDVILNLGQVWLSVAFLAAGLGIQVQAYRAFLPGAPKG